MRQVRLIIFLLLISCVSNHSVLTAQDDTSAKSKYRYYLSVAAIFRDDARFLKEWIEFHRLVGVEHFYLYNNLSSDNYKEVLEPYIQSGIVELIEWPYESYNIKKWSSVQNHSYTDAVNRSRKATMWLAIIDTDEFLFPVEQEDLRVVLKGFEQFGGVGVNWQMFGTSNVPRIPDDGLMIENLLLMAPEDYSDHTYVKSIVRPVKVDRVPNPHYASYYSKWFSVNENKEKIGGRWSPYTSVNKLRINHYWSRDEEFFNQVKLARESKFSRDLQFCITKNEEINQVYDDVILRFAPALQERMFQLTSVENAVGDLR